MICSKCKTQVKTEPFDNVSYCPKCGNKLHENHCSSNCKDIFFDNQPRVLNDADLYCKYCGSKSTYLIEGILDED